MSQNDFNIANQGFPATRADINSALQSLASNSAGASAPSTTYAYQLWYDSSTNLLKMRNADNDGWITLAFFDQTNDEWEVRSSVIQAVDSAGVSIKTDDGTARLTIADDGNVGIGTSSPSYPLDVKMDGSGGSVTARIYNDGTTSSDDASLRIGIAGTTAESKILFGDGGSGTVGRVSYDHNTDTVAIHTNSAEAMRIDGSQNIMFRTTDTNPATNNVEGHAIGATAEFSRSGSNPVDINRVADGTLIVFRGQGSSEGNISVSGTTVSYNGGHLSRWSQTADNSRIDLLKGTVMTNLDQMAVWGDEENEQLNCMDISSVEGDANVAGAFVNWDEDDQQYTSDMNVAMTGDFIIRIAENTTVERGDLLMSAGDGTAKPQGDDIVRSKTIAKVTSTHVTCTYPDGSYCVPCVLMAC